MNRFKALFMLLNVRKSIPFVMEFMSSKEVKKSKKMLIVGFTILYCISPIDIIPDFILGLGFLDDVAVVSWALKWMINSSPQSLKDKYQIQ